MAEGRRQGTDGRGQNTEDRRQEPVHRLKTQDARQKVIRAQEHKRKKCFICHLYPKMFKNSAFIDKYCFFVSADTKTCGSPLSATSVAIVIIPNRA